jgi:hypothetical protein
MIYNSKYFSGAVLLAALFINTTHISAAAAAGGGDQQDVAAGAGAGAAAANLSDEEYGIMLDTVKGVPDAKRISLLVPLFGNMPESDMFAEVLGLAMSDRETGIKFAKGIATGVGGKVYYPQYPWDGDPAPTTAAPHFEPVPSADLEGDDVELVVNVLALSADDKVKLVTDVALGWEPANVLTVAQRVINENYPTSEARNKLMKSVGCGYVPTDVKG